MTTTTAPPDRAVPLPGQVLMDVETLDSYRDDGNPGRVAADVDHAKVITSLLAVQADDGPKMHRPVLDVDMPVHLVRDGADTRVRIFPDVPTPITHEHRLALHRALVCCGIVHHADPVLPGPGVAFVAVRPVVVVGSSTPGHHHLYIDRRLTWRRYQQLLQALVDVDVLEPGYVAAAVRRGHTAVRLPWVHKQPAPPPPTSAAGDPWGPDGWTDRPVF